MPITTSGWCCVRYRSAPAYLDLVDQCLCRLGILPPRQRWKVIDEKTPEMLGDSGRA